MSHSNRVNRVLLGAALIGATCLSISAKPTHAQTATATATPVVTNCPDDAKLQASQETDIVAAVNKARVAANLNPVTINKLLDIAAQRQSNDMAAKDFLDHTGSDGSSPGDRVTAASYNWATYGENILSRLDMSAAGAYTDWWNSPLHKANMMNSAFMEIDVAFACTVPNAKYYYTMVLAASADAANTTTATLAQ